MSGQMETSCQNRGTLICDEPTPHPLTGNKAVRESHRLTLLFCPESCSAQTDRYQQTPPPDTEVSRARPTRVTLATEYDVLAAGHEFIEA